MWRHCRSTLTSFYTPRYYGRQKIETHETVVTSNNKASVEIGSRFKIKGDTTAGDLATRNLFFQKGK